MPHLKELHERWSGDGLVILGVHTQRKAELAHDFARKEALPYPICIDSSGQTVKRFGVNSYPDYYVVDREGVLRYADLANNEVDRVLEELLTEQRESPFALAVRSFGARHPRLGLALGEGDPGEESLLQLRLGRDANGAWIEIEQRAADSMQVSRMRLADGLPLLRHRVFEAGAVQWDLSCDGKKLKGKGPRGSVLRNLDAWPTSPLAPLLLSAPLAAADRRHRDSGGIGASMQSVRYLALGREATVEQGRLVARLHPEESAWIGVDWFPSADPRKKAESSGWFDEEGQLVGLESGEKGAVTLLDAQSTEELARRLLGD